MPVSLYDVSVRTYLQIVEAVGGCLALGLDHCRKEGIDPEEIVEARLYPDMFPFRFQVQSVAFHSLGAVEGIKTGLQAVAAQPQYDYAGLQSLLAETLEGLRKVSPEEIDSRAGAEVTFRGPRRKVSFVAEDFLLSFSLPNFYFHAATAYDILRMKGVPVGKLNFLGPVRIRD